MVSGFNSASWSRTTKWRHSRQAWRGSDGAVLRHVEAHEVLWKPGVKVDPGGGCFCPF